MIIARILGTDKAIRISRPASYRVLDKSGNTYWCEELQKCFDKDELKFDASLYHDELRKTRRLMAAQILSGMSTPDVNKAVEYANDIIEATKEMDWNIDSL